MGLVIIYRLGGSGILEDHVEKTHAIFSLFIAPLF